ncbi:MAG TPA: hypothetical protein VJX67_05905, partial [Blastocatellia bacterium]|nr:hypothetical protein [Blastocatellia bacterium]
MKEIESRSVPRRLAFFRLGGVFRRSVHRGLGLSGFATAVLALAVFAIMAIPAITATSSTFPVNPIAVSASGRGNPRLSLQDGFDVPTAYTGKRRVVQSLRPAEAKPLALVTDDFNGDGIPDLVSGYSTASGGILTLHVGNREAIFPSTPEAQV